MSEYRCPEIIFRMFDKEETKGLGRAAIVGWMSTLNAKIGDTVIAPHPETGEEQSFIKERPRTV